MNKYVSFVFDDSFQNEYLFALPLFKKYNLKACTAVISDKIGGTKDETGEKHSSLEELKEMYKEGWEILSHTSSHRDLTTVTSYEVEEELGRSKKDLEALGFQVNSLVYPLHRRNSFISVVANRFYSSARAGVQKKNNLPLE